MHSITAAIKTLCHTSAIVQLSVDCTPVKQISSNLLVIPQDLTNPFLRTEFLSLANGNYIETLKSL